MLDDDLSKNSLNTTRGIVEYFYRKWNTNSMGNTDTSFFAEIKYAHLENYNAYLSKKLLTYFVIGHLGLISCCMMTMFIDFELSWYLWPSMISSVAGGADIC